MANAGNLSAAILALTSLILLAIAIATNSWVVFNFPRSEAAAAINPLVTDTGLPGTRLTYDLDYFGLWVGCHREQAFNKISCAFISSSCYSNVCWTRNNKDKTCKNARITALSNCTAFRAVRAFSIMGTIALILGAAILLVSICVISRNLVWSGFILTAMSTIFLIIAFAIFHANTFRSSGIAEFATIGWSFVMLIVAWPVAAVASVLAVLGALSTPSKPYDYEEEE